MIDNELAFTRTKSNFEGFDLKFRELLVWVPESKRFRTITQKKTILKGMSGHIKSGTMTTIIGPSGSGKTTLMNFLSGRQTNSQQFKTHCKYFINDTRIESVNEFKNIIGYVLQDDIMDIRMTPRKLFEHYARLRGKENYKAKAQEIIDDLGLQKCANTVVGGLFERGISGGEKKRTSIGIELVSEPNLLFLDEPTTGLDSTTALDIIKTLADLKSRGITIVTTIHQPSQEIMAYFDQVFILCDGHIIYDNSPKHIPDLLHKHGFDLPNFETPVEYFMKIIDRDDICIRLIKEKGEAVESEVNEIYKSRINKFIQSAQKEAMTRDYLDGEHKDEEAMNKLRYLARHKNQNIPVLKQMHIFLQIYTKLFFKDVFGIITKSILFWFSFLLLIVLFVKTPAIENNPRDAMQNKGGFYFMLIIVLFFLGNNSATTLFLPQKQIFMKDQQGRIYSKFAFFWSNSFYIIPFFIVNVSVSIIIYFYAIGLNNDHQSNLAWLWAFFTFGAWLGGTSVGLFVSMLVDRIEDIGALTPVFVLPMIVVAGFFSNIKSITWPLFIYSFISIPRFIFQGVTLVEFQNAAEYRQHCVIKVPCPQNPNQICQTLIPPEKADVCDPSLTFDFYETDVWKNFVITIALVIGWRLLAFVLFLARYRERETNYGFDKELFDLYCNKSVEQGSGPIEVKQLQEPTHFNQIEKENKDEILEL